MKEHFPNITDYKILLTVSYLNKKGYYPLNDGVLKIVSGVIDDETVKFQDCPTYQTLLSLNGKKISRLINMLLRYQYLQKTYHQESDKLYLKITPKGEAFLMEYSSKHRINLKVRTKKEQITIVKI